MPRPRKAVAVACIALIVFAAFLPLGAMSLDWLVVTPPFTLLPPFEAPELPREALARREQTAALLAIVGSRGPPIVSSLS